MFALHLQAKIVFALVLLLFCSAARGKDGDQLIGTRAPELNVTNWFNSEPLTLSELRGKVVLIRWWTAPQCPYCRMTAPALNEFHSKFRDKGLQVIGVYHHKSDKPLRIDDVKRHARAYGFKFPIAIDPDWQTLQEWWLRSDNQRWTSVTFLLDRNGVIRHIHPGGQYVKGDDGYKALQREIEALLATE